jgi:uncharacterized protein DUF5658
MAAYWRGALQPRRRAGRRASDTRYPIIDWHSPRVFALAFAILALCATDGVLTVMLLAQGAVEINPLMALFVPHNLGWFAAIKLLLTGIGVCVLVVCARMRLFRRVPGEALVYAVLVLYVCLITYELQLLERVPLAEG